MAHQSTKKSSGRKAVKQKPQKPYPDFPLYAHASGRWAKKIKGKLYYFGPWDDPNGALEKFLGERDDLYAGRTPQQLRDALTVRELCNLFIASKRVELDAGKLSPRTFVDYDRVCKRLVEEFATRAVTSLRPSDFEALYAKMTQKYSINTMIGEITMTRSVFKYAIDIDLIDKNIKFGPKFKVPSKQDKRKAKAKAKQLHGKKMFQAAEIRAMLDNASTQLKAMILLGINGGLGNTDCAMLPRSALDLDGGWLDYARVKTGIDRRVPLWPETVAALREAIAKRKTPVDEADADAVFVTKYGQRWVRYEVVEEKRFGKVKIKPKQDDAIAKETAKLLRELKIKRPGVGFYALRHTFETIAGGSQNQVAVDAIMGHVDSSMAADYREYIDDARLRAVVDHVHDWLFSQEGDDDNDDAEPEEEETDRPRLRVVG